ncbi:MAG: hypothetical protein WC455_26840 [Dehalococcoidia bacterium]|jgi:hypothetical protein
MIPVREPLRRRALKWLVRTEWRLWKELVKEALKQEGYYTSKWPDRTKKEPTP